MITVAPLVSTTVLGAVGALVVKANILAFPDRHPKLFFESTVTEPISPGVPLTASKLTVIDSPVAFPSMVAPAGTLQL